MAGDRTYAEAEHLALMADAVTRETAELTSAKAALETKVSELAARVDVLEAEKSTAETLASTTKADLDAYKADVERAREVEAAKQDRLTKVKAANNQLPETYFTDERIQRWAEMTEQAFASLIEDLGAATGAGSPKETASFAGGDSPTATKGHATVGSIFAARRGAHA